MGKRFTDTDKWKDEWYMGLSNDYRIIWQYICDGCTPAGRLKKNFRLLNFCCNTSIDEDKFKEIFIDRALDMGDFFFFPGFLKFQYPKGLNSDKPAVISVRHEILQYGLLKIVKQSLGNDYLIVKDKDKEKTKTRIDKDKTKEEGRFDPKVANLIHKTAKSLRSEK